RRSECAPPPSRSAESAFGAPELDSCEPNFLDEPSSEISYQSGEPGDEHQEANGYVANPKHSTVSVDCPKPKDTWDAVVRVGAELAIVRQACNPSKQEEGTDADAD